MSMRLHPGETETEAVGWRVVTVLDAVRQLRDAAPDVTGRPRVIAIDGRGGAGKTTLAERLCKAVPNSGTGTRGARVSDPAVSRSRS